MNFGHFTIALVLITVLISIPAMSDDRLVNKLILWPRKMDSPGEYYRLLTSGFIHADWGHLFFNMFTLLFIGSNVESAFSLMSNPWLYVAMYLSGIIVASLPSFIKNKNNSYYRSLGASGGVAAVLFSMVYLSPWSKLYIYFFRMPSIVFGVLYLIYSAYMSRKGHGNINHDAHFFGAVYGLIFTFAIDPTHGQLFLQQIVHPSF